MKRILPGLKRLVVFLVVFIVCFGLRCEYNDEPWEDFDYWFKFEPVVENLCDVLDWVSTNIDYETDGDYGYPAGYLKTPKQTYDDRRGDCDDYAILVGYLCWKELKKDPDEIFMVVVGYEYAGMWEYHSIVMVEGKCYEPQAGCWQIEKDYDPLAGGWWETIEYIPIKEALWAACVSHKDTPLKQKKCN
jgi:hypothetical protein